MDRAAILDRATDSAKRSCKRTSRPASTWRQRLLLALATGLALTAGPALAVDGCVVLLCFAAPNWGAIPKCVPPIRRVLRDLALGRPFPICAMSGAGNTAGNQWASVPDNCPPQYTRAPDGINAVTATCDYSGAVSVNIAGSLWARTWWSMGGDTVTEFTPTAKAAMASYNTRFDQDYAVWFSLQPPPVDPSLP